jgi:hypothetical protein
MALLKQNRFLYDVWSEGIVEDLGQVNTCLWVSFKIKNLD